MNATELLTGPKGHPTHPPLTDAVIGLYTGAAGFAILSALGISEENTAIAWWLSLVAALVVSLPTAVTGFLDWLKITSGTPLWRTATIHFVAMISASVILLLAAVLGHAGYADREVNGSGLLLTLIGFGVLTLGGWFGGTIVYVHGMRVLKEPNRPAAQAAAPGFGEGDAAGGTRGGMTRTDT